LHRCLAARRPGQRFDLAVGQVGEGRPNLIAGDAGQPCVDNRMEDFEIDRLGDVIVRSQASRPQLAVTIVQPREDDW